MPKAKTDQTGQMPRLTCLRWAYSHIVGFVMRWLIFLVFFFGPIFGATGTVFCMIFSVLVLFWGYCFKVPAAQPHPKTLK